MYKIIAPETYDFREPQVQEVKASSRGLIGRDFTLLEKRAGSELAHLAKKVANDLHPGETLVHLLALGATESFGPNRNGDGFRDEVCRKYHDTFRKHARWYRNHQNKDPSKSYGVVKLSYYNEPMRRVELLVALNRTKEAAQRNGGLVADKEHEKLASGDTLPVSMACLVSHDICSWCGNKAPNRSKYCDGVQYGGQCKAGGLKRNMGRVVELVKEGQKIVHHLHADNPDPKFFDISYVIRPADPTAYVFGVVKQASQSNVSGAELAEFIDVSLPDTVIHARADDAHVERQYKWLAKLASLELSQSDPLLKEAAHWLKPAVLPTIQVSPIDPPKSSHPARLLGALAKFGCVLSPEGFLQVVAGRSMPMALKLGAVIRPYLAGIYTKLHKEASVPGDKFATLPPTQRELTWAARARELWAVDKGSIQKRGFYSETVAPAEPFSLNYGQDGAERLAREYALYKIAALASIGEPEHNELAGIVAVLQNNV